MRHGNTFGHVCLSVSWALTFESLDLETLFCFAVTSSEYLGHVHILRSSGQGHRSEKCVYVPFLGGPRLTETQSCYIIIRSTSWKGFVFAAS